MAKLYKMTSNTKAKIENFRNHKLLCSFCDCEIQVGQKVVSTSNKLAKLYHVECYEKMFI